MTAHHVRRLFFLSLSATCFVLLHVLLLQQQPMPPPPPSAEYGGPRLVADFDNFSNEASAGVAPLHEATSTSATPPHLVTLDNSLDNSDPKDSRTITTFDEVEKRGKIVTGTPQSSTVRPIHPNEINAQLTLISAGNRTDASYGISASLDNTGPAENSSVTTDSLNGTGQTVTTPRSGGVKRLPQCIIIGKYLEE